MNNKRVVVIGGGITGLTTAYRLQKEMKEKGIQGEVLLVEASTKLGGKIQTVRRDGFVIERGPDSFLERKQSAVKLVKELGLGDQLVNNATGKSFVLLHNKMYPIPEGSNMGIPTKIAPFIFSGLFSPAGKIRAGFDFILPKDKGNQADQSLGTFFRRRFGDEVVEHLIEPLLSGIYAGNIDEMSLMATFPNFYAVEQKYGSIIRGLRTMSDGKTQKKGPKKGIFMTLKGGLTTLVGALRDELDENMILRGTKICKIEKVNNGYDLYLASGDKIYADIVVVATSHKTLPVYFSDHDFFNMFESIPSTSVANVGLAFKESDIQKIANGTGFVVSRKSEYTFTACTWTNKKWPHTTPEGYALLRCYLGKPGDELILDSSDEELVNIALNDLRQVMDINVEPLFSVVTRWKEAMPQYTVGHKERLAAMHEYVNKNLPGIFIAGSSYEGTGLPDCISQGEKAAANIIKYIEEQQLVSQS
ncbi:MAG: protoporphyrinogen oxidase [Bacillaceae bacterium]